MFFEVTMFWGMIKLNKYIYWSDSLELRRYPNNTILVKKSNNIKGIPNRENIQTLTLNDTAAEIIQLIDGTKTYDEIISFLSLKYNESFSSIDEKVKSFLHNMSNTYNLKVNTQEHPKEKPVYLVDESTIYPTVASIELTNKCNLRCLHCYGDFGNVKHRVMSLEEATSLLSDLKNMGVKIVELTGGEMSTHPKIKEILLHAIDLKFDQISLLTNGLALTNEIKNIVIKNKSRIFMQIDLHSLDDGYLTWFTKIPNTLDKIKRNIEDLAKNNVQMRIATIVTRKNIDEIEEIADWVYNLGIKHFGVSPVVELGRAEKSDRDLFINEEDAIKLEKILQRIYQKYGNFLSIIEGDRDKNRNCGCVASHCVISSNGDIKICTMDNMEHFKINVGNVFKNNIKDIYDNNSEYISNFFNLRAPQIDSIECADCVHKYFCSACVLRGLIKAKEIGNQCLWYTNKVPDLIKEKLSFESS
jgi:radical SAM protein with 4Fe4S-binding SPASM domain